MNIRTIIFSPQIQMAENQSTKQQVTLVVDPTYKFLLKYIPSNFSFSVLVIFEGMATPSDTVNVIFRNKNSETELFKIDYPLTAEMIETIPNDGYPSFNLNLQLNNIEIENPGEYVMEVYINRELSKTEKVYFGKIV